ncbi:hypothetical protein Hhel01_02534 [Haloferula helveola]
MPSAFSEPDTLLIRSEEPDSIVSPPEYGKVDPFCTCAAIPVAMVAGYVPKGGNPESQFAPVFQLSEPPALAVIVMFGGEPASTVKVVSSANGPLSVLPKRSSKLALAAAPSVKSPVPVTVATTSNSLTPVCVTLSMVKVAPPPVAFSKSATVTAEFTTSSKVSV